MLKTTNQKIAVGLLLFAIFYLILTFKLPAYPYVPVDSDVIPMGLGFLLIVLSILLYFVKDKQVQSEDQKQENKIPGKEKLMLLAVLGITILYILLLEPLGFILSTVIFIFGSSRFLGYKNYLVNGLVSIIFPLAVYFAFTKGLQVALPPGILPF